MYTPERHLPTSGQHGPAPSGTPPLAQPTPPPQTRETQSHSVPTPLKRPMLTPEGGPRPSQGQALRHMDAGPSTKGADARIVPNGTTARSAPLQSPSQMLPSHPGFFPLREGSRFIFLLIPGAEGSERGLSPEGHLRLSAIPVLEARHSLEVESRRSRAFALPPCMSCPQVDNRQKDRRRFRTGVCTASASESLSCRGSSAHVATSSSRSTAAGGVLLGHEAPKQLSRSLCMAGRHRMRVRLRPRASSLRFIVWKTRRRLALRRCLEFGDVEGASASVSSGQAVRAGRADCGARGGTAAGERRVGAACAERFPASRANTMVMPPTRTSSAPARFARRNTRRRSCSVTLPPRRSPDHARLVASSAAIAKN